MALSMRWLRWRQALEQNCLSRRSHGQNDKREKQYEDATPLPCMDTGSEDCGARQPLV